MLKKTLSWRNEFLEIISRRDRLTQNAILEDFNDRFKLATGYSCDLCDTRRVHNEGEDDFFITGVVGNRWYVSWEFDKEKNCVTALALGLDGEQSKNRKEIELLMHRSHLGHFQPRWWKRRSCDECHKENTA